MRLRVVALLGFWFFGSSVSAQQCDCQQVVGQCVGAVEFVKGFGSTPSFGAEIIIHSSEKRCSKVEYFLDSTPHQTVLVNRQKESESLFGTSPISAANVKYSACRICTVVGEEREGKRPGNSDDKAAPSPFDGVWVGTLRWFIASDPIEVHVSSAGGKLSGYTINKTGTFQMQSPRVSGDVLRWSYVGIDGSPGNATVTKTGQDSAVAVFDLGDGISFKGELTRR